ncbi:BTAD domain-containing putative transcriptional regulator [Actinomycetospora sp. OC33-EN08]|uniref:BTAD domain-containing putative transcriptional regulator n=1 Tax=Actinomycetospora aurantiaca TaxID=3129233 RepID=A0ABU8MGQ2_9PSEU
MGRTAVRLLGDVAVLRDGGVHATRSHRLRTLLALLALRAGEPVAGDVLIDEAWGEDLPQNPRGTLQVNLTRLRDWLRDVPLTVADGLYTLHLDPADVDLPAFLTAADAALGTRSPELFATAAARWREPVLPGLETPRLAAARTHAAERYRALTVRHATLLLELGRPDEAVDRLADADRLDERLAALLVRALRDAGRPRDALAVSLDVRRRLREEVGAEPGEELARLHASLVRRSAPARRGPDGLVGREDLVDDLVALREADGRIVVLEAPAGAGKTAVLRAVLATAAHRGARTAGSAWGAGGAPAEPWHELADDLGSAGRPGRSLGPRLHDHLVRLAAAGPVVLALDDAHRADSASLDVLRVLARRGLPAGVVLVVAARAPDAVARPAWEEAVADLLAEPRLERRGLGPLSADAVARLTTSRLAHLPVDDALVATVRARTRGHALHLAALLEVVAAATTPDEARRAADTVPPQVLGLLDHQVSRLPDATRGALEALAVLAPLALADLARVLEVRPLQLADDLAPAARAGLATAEPDRFVLRHDLDTDALRARVAPVRAAHLHLARLETGGITDVFTVLRHTEGAAAVLEPPRVAAARVAAGVESYRRRALPEALALLDAADAAPDELVPTLVVHRALCRSALGERPSDDELDAAVDLALAAGEDELALLVAVGDEPLGLVVDGDPRRSARLQRLLDRPLRPRHRLDLLAAYIREESATARRGVPALIAEAREIAVIAVEEDPTALARVRALEARDVVDGGVPALERLAIATDAHRLAFGTDDPALHLDAVELLMGAELAAGRVEQAQKWRLELERAAARWFRPRSIWGAAVAEAAMLLAEGDPDADVAAQRAAARGTELGLPDAGTALGAHMLVALLLRGAVDGVADVAAATSGRALNTAAWAAAAAVAELVRGRPDAARAHLAEYRHRAVNPSMWFKRVAAALASTAALGLADRAAAELVLARLGGDPDAAVVAGFGAAVLGPEVLWTGLAAWTLGDIDRARECLTTAVTYAERAGWRPWADAARRFLAALDDPSAPLPFGLPRG